MSWLRKKSYIQSKIIPRIHAHHSLKNEPFHCSDPGHPISQSKSANSHFRPLNKAASLSSGKLRESDQQSLQNFSMNPKLSGSFSEQNSETPNFSYKHAGSERLFVLDPKFSFKNLSDPKAKQSAAIDQETKPNQLASIKSPRLDFKAQSTFYII